MRVIFTIVTALVLSACTSAQIADTRQCVAALLASGATDTASLFVVAATTPACLALGGDAIQTAVLQAAAARRINTR